MSDDNQQVSFSQSGDDTSQQQQQQSSVTNDTSKNGLQGDSAFLIVGERAFATKEDVTKNITNAQSHIKTIETENAQLREKTQNLTQEVERLKLAVEGMQQGGKETSTAGKDDQTGNLSKEELVTAVVQQVRSTMTSEQRETVRTNNINTVFAEAKTAYGDKVYEKVGAKATELHMTPKDVDEMAMNNPAVFRQLFLPTNGTQQSHQSGGSVNTASLNGDDKQKTPFNVTKHSSKEIADEVQRRLAMND